MRRVTRSLVLPLLLACAPPRALPSASTGAAPPADLRGDRGVLPSEPERGPERPAQSAPKNAPDSGPASAPRADGVAAGAAFLSEGAEQGWSVFRAAPDARVVYVSSSRGDDAHDGLAPEGAKRTLAAGKALLRHGFPDWLLLARGDRFEEPLGQWRSGGRSRAEPALVASFGDDPRRPVVVAAGCDGLVSGAFAGSPPRIDHLAFVGIALEAARTDGARDTPYGVVWRIPSEDLLFEDCRVEGFFQNVVIETLDGRSRDVRIRRSVVVDAHTAGSGHAQGFYAHAVDGLTIEESLFDHNGWRAGLAGAEPTVFRHDVYVQVENSGVRVVGNVIARAGSHGLQMRSGGLVRDNLFLANPIALLLGNKTGDPVEPFEARDNVILDGADIGPGDPRGWGIEVASCPGGVIAGNVVAQRRGGSFPLALVLFSDRKNPDGVHGLALERNVFHDWGGPLLLQGAPPLVDGLTLVENDVQDGGHAATLIDCADGALLAALELRGNRLHLAGRPSTSWLAVAGAPRAAEAWSPHADALRALAVAYADPTRDVARYHALQGGAEERDAFLEACRAQARPTFRPELAATRVNAWIRAGFAPADAGSGR